MNRGSEGERTHNGQGDIEVLFMSFEKDLLVSDRLARLTLAQTGF